MARRIGGPFGRSAFGPLYEHLIQVVKTTRLLRRTGEEFAHGRFDGVREAARLIDHEEGIADEVKEEIRRHLSQSLFSAVQRSDTLILLGLQDDVADSANDTAKLISVRDTRLPDALDQPFLALTEAVVATTEALQQASKDVYDLLESGQASRQADGVSALLGSVRSAEFRAEQLEHDFLKSLFTREEQADPVTVVLLMNIAQQLGQVAHSSEKVSECLERMVAQR
jgi:predicted phosphate transport protein (TIGR00153 family)